MNVKNSATPILLAVILQLCADGRAADWPTFLGPARDGCSPDTG